MGQDSLGLSPSEVTPNASDKMDEAVKQELRAEIQIHLSKFPGAGSKKLKKLLKQGIQIVDLDQLKANTLNKLRKYNIGKFKGTALAGKGTMK